MITAAEHEELSPDEHRWDARITQIDGNTVVMQVNTAQDTYSFYQLPMEFARGRDSPR